MARERHRAAVNPIFTSSVDLQNDPDIQKIRDAAQERMARVLLNLVQEGQAQGEVNLDVSDKALQIYFKLFMDVFTDPELQSQFYSDPQLVPDLGALMMYGLRGPRK